MKKNKHVNNDKPIQCITLLELNRSISLPENSAVMFYTKEHGRMQGVRGARAPPPPPPSHGAHRAPKAPISTINDEEEEEMKEEEEKKRRGARKKKRKIPSPKVSS